DIEPPHRPGTLEIPETVSWGGTCPGVALDTFVVEPDTRARSVSAVAGRLRRGDPPVLARVEDDRLSLDPRTVEPEEEALLVERVVRACLPDED
ncbi:MAG: hypothetical protein OXI50_14125, partial [Gammaproteobacteria bacterium]|nr:hypothetical protein [Gammaproteobacteria bacterium]